MKSFAKIWQGFSKLNLSDRLAALKAYGILTEEEFELLNRGGLQTPHLADQCIENALGYFQLPFGVAAYFEIDHRDYAIPLAIEETSVIAALSKTAKWIRQHGHITTSQQGACIIGQIQFPMVNDLSYCLRILHENEANWIEQINTSILAPMVARGGGLQAMQYRVLDRPEQGQMLIVHVLMDPCDAMGANLINQVLEYLKPLMQAATQEKVHLCILSNLNDQKLTTAKVVLNHIPRQEGEAIMEASLFAEIDPYRAATHNKGIMNGIDGVLIATGNDWRAVEAGMHAYAAVDGHYKALSRWRFHQGQLTGELTAPIVVGTVGGVTKLHPMAKLALSMMRIRSASQLARVVAAVGLVQNLAAIRALATEGIIQGHMRLHIDNILLAFDLQAEELQWLKQALIAKIAKQEPISERMAAALLETYRLGII